MTSSYLRTFLRISKLRASTCDWADWIDRVTIFDSSGRSSGNPARFIIDSAMPELNSRMRSSGIDR